MEQWYMVQMEPLYALSTKYLIFFQLKLQLPQVEKISTDKKPPCPQNI